MYIKSMTLAKRTIERLRAERDQLAATVERLREALEEYADHGNWGEHEDEHGGYLCWRCRHKEPRGSEIAQSALAATPAQNLAKVRAEALRDVCDGVIFFEEASTKLMLRAEADRIEAEAAR